MALSNSTQGPATGGPGWTGAGDQRLPYPANSPTVRLPYDPTPVAGAPMPLQWSRVRPAPRPGPRVRLGDSERSAACDLLTRHYTEGRLLDSEFEQRIEAAVAARYGDELRALFADLPRLGEQPSPKRETTPSPDVGVARVIATVLAVTAAVICLFMVAGIGAYEAGLGVVAMFGGLLAALGGSAIGWLFAHRRSSGSHRA